MLKRRLLTLNASCEENESDFFCDLGHDPENASGPFPVAAAHAPVMPSENAVSLQEKSKPHSGRNNSMGDGRGSSRTATNTRPNSFRKHHQARSLGFRSNLNLNLRLVRAPKHSGLAPQALNELFVSRCRYDAHTYVYDNVSCAHAKCSELLTSSRRGSTPAAAHFLSNADK